MSRINYFGFFERIKVARVTQPSWKETDEHDITAKRIELLRAELKECPNEWIYWYALCDDLYAIFDYAGAVRAAEKCYELRPRDPRSTFALAVAYKYVAMAIYADDRAFIDMMVKMMASGVPTSDVCDPKSSKKALSELGISIDQAAERGMKMYAETLALGVTHSDAESVYSSLNTMRAKFPHLSEKISVPVRGPRLEGLG